MKLKALPVTSLEDVTLDFEQLQTLDILNLTAESVLQLAVAGTKRQVAFGLVGITFSASQSGSGTITHNLGRTPGAVLLTWNLAPGSGVVLGADTFTTTTAVAHGWNTAVLTGTFNASYLVIG
jgi:hypothetical protein